MQKISPLPVAAATAAVCAVTALTAFAAGTPVMGKMGPSMRVQRSAFQAYYDGHKDTYLNTDVSDKAEAKAMHVNYSAALKAVPLATAPAMYMVVGRSAPNQIAVFGSEPGESNYSPIWQEVFVHWKAGTTPVLLVKDDQIKELAMKGKLTLKMSGIRLDCPIIKVGHGST
jgi:hypothetical protein